MILLFIAGFGKAVIVRARSVKIELGAAVTGVENADVPFVGSVMIAAILSVAKLKSGPVSKVAMTTACPLESAVTVSLSTGLDVNNSMMD